jgi:DNA mismatch endonuclease (patch repair protein)
MTDRLTAEERSRNMARIRGGNTVPERVLRSGLHRLGLRFRLHSRALPGRPDLVLRRHSAVIFVHGCFWHQHRGCRDAALPKTRPDFWAAKFAGNRRRDRRQLATLLTGGWRVLIVWECAVRRAGNRSLSIRNAARWIRGRSRYAEIAAGSRSSGNLRIRGIESGALTLTTTQ